MRVKKRDACKQEQMTRERKNARVTENELRARRKHHKERDREREREEERERERENGRRGTWDIQGGNVTERERMN